MATEISRYKVYTKTQGHCAYCGLHIDFDESWHIEHVVPKAQGGSDHIYNLFMACRKCNLKKKARTPHQFRKHILSTIKNDLLRIIETIEKFGLVDMKDTSINYSSGFISILMESVNYLEPDPEISDKEPVIKFFSDSIMEEEWKMLREKFNNDIVEVIKYQDSLSYKSKG